MARPGQNTLSGCSWMNSTASFKSLPYVGKSGGNPSPRKERALSVIIAFAIPSVADTIIGEKTFGRICRIIIFPSVPPIDFAARINSLSFIASTSPLTILAVGIQLVTPIDTTIRINIPFSGPKELLRCLETAASLQEVGVIGAVKGINR